MTTLVQYVPGDSLFHRLDPRAKIIFMLLVTAVIFVTRSRWVAAAILITLLVLWTTAQLPLSVLKGLGKAIAGIVVFLFVVQALLYPGERILVHPIIPDFIPLIGGTGRITVEGLLFATLLSLRLLAMVVVLPLVSMTTPVHIFLLGLIHMGLPYRLAYTMTTALNLIPTLQLEAAAIVDAQRLRAFQVFEKGNFLQKLKAYPPLVTPLVIGAMRRAQLIAVAMESRAFGATTERTYIHQISLQPMDYGFIGFTALFSVSCLIAGTLLT